MVTLKPISSIRWTGVLLAAWYGFMSIISTAIFAQTEHTETETTIVYQSAKNKAFIRALMDTFDEDCNQRPELRKIAQTLAQLLESNVPYRPEKIDVFVSYLYDVYQRTIRKYGTPDRSEIPAAIKGAEECILKEQLHITDKKEEAPIVTARAAKELEFRDFVEAIDRTVTAVGYAKLGTFKPTNNPQVIMARQNKVRVFVEDQNLYTDVRKGLIEYRKKEHVLIGGAWLKNPVSDLYYTCSLIRFFNSSAADSVAGTLNNSRLALEGSALYKTLEPLFGQMARLTAIGFIQGIAGATDAHPFEVLTAPLQGITSLFTPLHIRPTILTNGDITSSKISESIKDEDGKVIRHMVTTDRLKLACSQGSLADKIAATVELESRLSSGINNTTIGGSDTIPKFIDKIWEYTFKYPVDGTRTGVSWVSDKLADLPCKAETVGNGMEAFAKSRVGKAFGMDSHAKDYKYAAEVLMRNKVHTLFYTGLSLYATLSTIQSLVETGKAAKSVHDRLHKARTQLVEVSQLIKRITFLVRIFDKYEVTKPYAKQIKLAMQDPKFKKLTDLLVSDTFMSPNGILYQRGKVLQALRYVDQAREIMGEIISIIGEVDVYCSMATVVREHANQDTKFAFVNFVEAPAPIADFQNVWMAGPMPTKPVQTSVKMSQGSAAKAIITGPTGAGKSVFLRTLGLAITSAHWFGIVPADSATMSFFEVIHTCFPTPENQRVGLSRFMAAKKDMDETTLFLNGITDKIVALFVDEPFSGTVESDKANRTYNFGIHIKDMKKLLCAIATHVEKPVNLEKDTHVFTNFQPEILEPAPGKFINTFKILPGPAMWWFTDQARVERYNDQISSRIRTSEQLDYVS